MRYLPSPTTLNGGSSRSLAFFCLAVVLIVTAGYAVSAAFVRPAVFTDSGFGFLNWDARHGLAFNHAALPDYDNISKDTADFQTAWSPGQHVLPGLPEEAGLSLGLSITVVTTVFSMLGLAGWYALYRGFDFPLRSSAIAVVLIACSHHVALPFGLYIGGEVLLFGTAPWFLLLVWKLRELRWWTVLPLLAGALVMVFVKLTGLIVAAAAILGAVGSFRGPWFTPEGSRRKLVAIATVVVMGLLFDEFWYSRGWTAVSSLSGIEPSLIAGHAAFALSAIATSSLSLVELGAYIFLHPARPLLESRVPLYYALLPLAVGVLVIVRARLRAHYPEYLRFLAVFALSFGAVLVWTWASGSAVTLEERHLRIPSLVLLIGIVHSFIELPSKLARLTFGAIVGVMAVYGVASAGVHVAANMERPLGIRGFRHWVADKAVIDFIRTIDVPAPDRRSTLIFVTSPDIGLEIRNVRVMSNQADLQEAAYLQTQITQGRVPRLYVIIQRRLVDQGKAGIILDSLVDYPKDSWKQTPVGSFICFSQP